MSTAMHTAVLPRSFTAATLCEAFQITAAERPGDVPCARPAAASRSRGTSTRAGAAHRRAGWPPRRPPRRHRRADAGQPPRVQPRRHGRDAPRRDAVLDLQHLLARADRATCSGTRQPGRDHRAPVPSTCIARRRIARASSTSSASTTTATARSRSADSRRHGRPDFDFEASLARRRARRRADPHLHVGHDRAAEGRAAHARRNLMAEIRGVVDALPTQAGGRIISYPALRAHRRPLGSHYQSRWSSGSRSPRRRPARRSCRRCRRSARPPGARSRASGRRSRPRSRRRA